MSSRFKSVNLNITKTKLLATLGVVAILFLPKVVFADKFDDQIKVLNKKVADNQNAANAKTAEANSLKSALSAIEAQINVAQTQLDITNTKISDTELEIKATNRELDRQRNILKDNLRLIYKEGYVSPLEIIASSVNLSDFVAKQQYLSAIREKIDNNLEKIRIIKKDFLLSKKIPTNKLPPRDRSSRACFKELKVMKPTTAKWPMKTQQKLMSLECNKPLLLVAIPPT